MRVGVFDSGIGGITVLNELRSHFLDHEFFYFGDSANVPYGTKSVSQIQSLCGSAAERIKSHHLDLLVVACNTASSLAFEKFKSMIAPVPVFGVVEAGVQAVLNGLTDRKKPILVLGTRATIRSGIYQRLLNKNEPGLKVYSQECPLLVPMIEEGWIDHPILLETVREYTKAYASLVPGIALLGCTHYPWIRKVFEIALPVWEFRDSAEAVAEQVQKMMNASKKDASVQASVAWYFSDSDAVSFLPQLRGQKIDVF